MIVFLCTFGLLLFCFSAFLRAEDGQLRPALDGVIDLPYLRDPLLALQRPQQTLDPRLEGLWLTALRRDEPMLEIEAMQAFVEAHKEHGATFGSQARAAIVEHLDAAHPLDVRLAAALAAHALDERSATDALAAMATQAINPYAISRIDQVLAEWDHAPMRPIWRQRAADDAAPRLVRISAIQSLGAVGDAEASELLANLATDAAAPQELRMAAASALGQYATDGLTPRAAALSREDRPGALLAVAMLGAHRDEASLALADELTHHREDAVAAAAARLLLAHAPQRLDTALATHADPDVRLSVTRAAVTDPSPASVELLADRLDDTSVTTRVLARDTLIAWADQPQLDDPIKHHIERIWSSAGWRGREQAALIAGWIDHKPLAEALAEALDDGRNEVRLAVCGALRLLSVDATASAMQRRLAALLEPPPAPLPAPATGQEQATEPPPIDPVQFRYHNDEATQLFLALGVMSKREAEPLYRKVVPKHSVEYGDARAAAIYVLGKWYEGVGEAELQGQFLSRMQDASMMDPEYVQVQVNCAVALGRMGAADLADALREAATNAMGVGGPQLQLAAMWAVERLTGEHLELPPTPPVNVRGWFLEPAD